ncbi:MAG: HK97 family phage prohead protease [Defluviitaleaceae bacterium]|nr:HK97 family phage prohead protease [Defluviitaleaceae bacterium]
MQRTKELEYRNLLMPLIAARENKRLESNYYIEGYATTFERYRLYTWDGVDYYEQIAPDALDGADMGDVIMQYDHQGKVLARQSNGTLGLEADNKGLFIFADLSKSTAAKEVYEEISAGLITKMSWAFYIEDEEYDKNTCTWIVKKVKEVVDVSAVSTPANDGTEISARGLVRRSFITSQQERLGMEKEKLKLKIKLQEA